MNKDRIEIFIITYNRCTHLSNVLETITSEKSPVREYSIKILDNNSDDGTYELCEKFVRSFSNIHYIKHNQNIGLAANICRAFEMATAEYMWLLCDNDEIKFDAWEEVEKAMDEYNDLIVLCNDFEKFCMNTKKFYSKYIKFLQCFFCSAGIYRVKNITNYILTLMYYYIPTSVPHIALLSKIINDNGKVVSTNPCVFQKNNEENNYTVNRIFGNEDDFFAKRIQKFDEVAQSCNYTLSEFLYSIQKREIFLELKTIIFDIMPYFSPDRIKQELTSLKDRRGVYDCFEKYQYLQFFFDDFQWLESKINFKFSERVDSLYEKEKMQFSDIKNSIVEDNLDIFIITYNRCEYLKKTLTDITNCKSPIRNASIKIIDNNSSDNTFEVCSYFIEKKKNIVYLKNHRNIGLSGNICRAMELAEKKYFWILCDNDEIKFDAWNEVEQAMKEDYDLILASRFYFPENYESFESLVLNQLTFLPSGIYKTKYMTDDVMCYAMLNTWTILPHMALGCNIINRKGKIFLPSKSIVNIIPNHIEIGNIDKYNFDRLESDELSLKNIIGKSVNFYNGIAHSFLAVKDKNISNKAMENFIKKDYINGYGPFLLLETIASDLKNKRTPFSYVFSFFSIVPSNIRIKFLKILIREYSYRKLIKIYPTSKGINLQIFQKIKIRIWKRGWPFFK